MRDQSVPEARWLTTAAVARMLERTPRWVRWLARTRAIACERTDGGVRIFREADVLRFLERTAQTRRVGRTPERLQMLWRDREPYQLSLFPRRAGAKGADPHAEVKPLRLLRKTA